MLADGVEASVRSLDEKDEDSIRDMVDRIVDARVEDGQLDDAELTLKDITQIKDAFVGSCWGCTTRGSSTPTTWCRWSRTGSRPDPVTLSRDAHRATTMGSLMGCTVTFHDRVGHDRIGAGGRADWMPMPR